ALFSPDGSRMATASGDGTARIWNVETGETTALFKGHTKAVVNVTFSPDGRRVLTASQDGTARLLDVTTGHEVGIFSGHRGGLWGADFSPDGTRVATASADKTARVWPVFRSTQALMDYAKAAVSRGLPPEKRKRYFLSPELPSGYVDMKKWPYDTQTWKEWLKYKRAGVNPPLPGSVEWESWWSARAAQ